MQRKLTPKDIQKIIKLHGDGVSHPDIAKILDVTTNTIHGHVGRLVQKGVLKGKNKASRKSASQIKESAKAERVVVSWDYPALGAGLKLCDLKENQCRFPCNNGLFCGAPIMKGEALKSYCVHHYLKSIDEKAIAKVKKRLTIF
jgi:hypothetical protein